MILSSKKDQTYEEALLAMQDTEQKYILSDISKRHYTEELLEMAIRNLRCRLQDIPSEKRTKRICLAVLETFQHAEVQYIPQELFDFDFSLKAASCCPTALSVILYRFRYGQWSQPYSIEDMRIIAEAACPRELGEKRLSEQYDKEYTLRGRSFEQYCSDDWGYVDRIQAHLFKQALDALISRESEGKQTSPPTKTPQ